MDRRKALKHLGILSGGLVMLPSCDFTKEKVSLTLNRLKITQSQEALMKELAACILPEDDLPGALNLEVHDFVWIMVDDCLQDEIRHSYLEGMTNFNKRVKELTGESFLKSKQEDRVKALYSIVREGGKPSDQVSRDVLNFVEITKSFTILGYMKSSYVMTEVMPYSLVPGSYGTCETIDNSKRINVNG